jgi:hypothetical protein
VTARLLLVSALCGLAISPVATADETTQLAAGSGAIWTCSNAGVIELDARTGNVLRHAYVGSDYPLQVALGSGAAWVAHVAGGYTAGGLTRFDLTTGRATTRLRSKTAPVFGVAAGSGRVWALTGPTASAEVTRVDPRAGRRIGVVRSAESPTSLAADNSGLWIATAQGWLLHARAEASRARKVVRLSAHKAPLVVAVGERSAWVAGDGTVVRVDERTNLPTARLRVAGFPVAAAVGRRALWLLVVRDQPWLVRVNTRTARVDAQRRVPSPSTSIAVGADRVWLATAERIPRVIRVDPKTLGLHVLAELL